MRNFIQPGDTIECVAPYAVASGGGALIGPGLFGVAAMDYASGSYGNFRTVGVYDMPKVSGAVTVGAKLYWDNTAKSLTTSASGNTLIGAAVQPAMIADTAVRIRLNGAVT